MRLHRMFASSIGLAIALTGLVALAVGGGLYAHRNLMIVQNESAEIEAGRLRDGIVSLGDLHRVTLALARAGDSIEAHETDALAEAVDFLYVRAEALRHAFEAGREAPATAAQADDASRAEIVALVGLLDEAISRADRLLAQTGADPDAARQRRAEAIDVVEQANRLLIILVNRQQQAQITALDAQSGALLNMTLSAAGLLVFFAIISAAALALLRAEVHSRFRRREAVERANHLAYFDQMTGLANRVQFTERLEAQLGRPDRTLSPPLVAFVDLDGFKSVNDTHGHGVGDELLKAVAARLQTVVDGTPGVASRLGGDEFAVIAHAGPEPGALDALCRRILDAIRAPLTIGEVALAPRASIGLAVANADVASVDILMQRADLALYEAKEHGRDTYFVYDDDLDERAERRRTCQRDLALAIGRQELFLVYQPQVRLSDGVLYGFEALVRWRREDRVVQPGEFISIAEATGLILDIDLWGLRTATRQLAQWRRETGVDATISVNLSALHFRGDAIVEAVSDALMESGLPPGLLTLEITETTLIEDWEHICGIIHALKALGVRVALDDFGSGYSSLNYLRQLGADLVKIDRSFLLDLENSGEARAILSSLVSLARDLEMDLLVEGVETQGQRRLLQEIGCTRAQGFLFSRPVETTVAGAMIQPLRAA